MAAGGRENGDDRHVAQHVRRGGRLRHFPHGDRVVDYESEEHRRNSLFTIATNVARDRRRRRCADPVAGATGAVEDLAFAGDRTAPHAETRADVGRAMGRLKPRERGLLWLAYGQGWSHREIAGAMGLRPASIKPLLFRARRRLAGLLRAGAPGAGEIGR